MPKHARHVITFVEPGTKLVFGAKTDDWSETAVQRREVRRCWAWPASTEELKDRGRDTTLDAYNVNMPPEVEAPASNARVILPNGGTYEIEGEVRLNPSPTGKLDYKSFYCERIVNRG